MRTSMLVSLASLAAISLIGAAPADAASARIAAALADPERFAADRAEDAVRHAEPVLRFLDLRPGMRVMDALAGGGYYTELLSRVVGPRGKVFAYNNPPYFKFGEKTIAQRYVGNRLPNVTQLTATIDDLTLEPASLDAVIFVMAYHDLYWRPADGSWPPTDPLALLRKIHAALKNDGVVLVQDHTANPNSDPSAVVNALHRIDPLRVRADFEAAGFRFERESKVLAHPADDHSKLVFDPAIRGKTDQFLYRFRKANR